MPTPTSPDLEGRQYSVIDLLGLISFVFSAVSLGIAIAQWYGVLPSVILGWIKRIPVWASVILVLLPLVSATMILSELSANERKPLYPVVISLGVAVVVLFCIILMRNKESQRLKQAFCDQHKITHLIRNQLWDATTIIRRGDAITNPFTELAESLLLESLCTRIADMFSDLTGKSIHACVYLINADPTGKPQNCFVTAHDKSVEGRDLDHEPVEIARCTWLRDICHHDGRGGITHYYAKNVNRVTGYQPEGPHQYPNFIVVPLRARRHQDLDGKNKFAIIGCLQVKTKSEGCLNGTFHVDIVAELADQLFTLLSVARLNRPKNSGMSAPGTSHGKQA